MASNCDHSTPQWRLADCNEDGWHCSQCDTKLGFRPDFDRKHTDDKVNCVLFWLHEHDFIHVSNASEGDGLVAGIVAHCRKTNTYDQQSIIGLIAAYGITSHAEYWRKEAERFLCSHPSRTIVGDAAFCDACGHTVKQAPSGPLFASEEPF